MKFRTRVAVVLLGATALGGVGVSAQAMTRPPTCIRECGPPVKVDTTGPCYGVILGNLELNNFCYLGPPPIP